MKIKIGTKKDGRVFKGYRKSGTEHWISVEAHEKSKASRSAWGKANWQKVKEDPEKHEQFKAKIASWQRSQRKKKPENYMLVRAKSRAKQKGLAFNLTLDDFEVPKNCPIFKKPLVVGSGGVTDWSPELDRIIPSKGYVRGNVIVISRRANRIKNDATVEELQLIASFYKRFTPKR